MSNDGAAEADTEISGTIEAIELETRKRVFLLVSKIAGCLAIKDDGPTRLLFSGGGHVDVCGPPRTFAVLLRLTELEAARYGRPCPR